MSNLKLPNMSRENLFTLAPANGDWKKIAYETYVRRNGLNVEVRHHSSTIAVLSKGEVYVDTHGYNSTTTTHRLNTIVCDNNCLGVRVAIRQYATVVLDSSTLKVLRPLTRETFLRFN